MKNSKRAAEHRKDQNLEAVLKELETLLGGVDAERRFESGHPVIFIMGCARSGTTLLSQLLAATTNWCYPSNLISRFYYAPYIGSLIQKMLYDLDTKGELLGKFKHIVSLSSNLGKTQGALSPHEFWYYWRRFFHFGEIQQLSEKELKKVDGIGFANGLKSIQTVFDAPLFLKGMILNWNIPFLAKLLPNAYFIHIIRDIRFNAQSLLVSRKNFFGDTKEWYSFKPPEYPGLSGLTPEEQVVHQVNYTNLAIKKGISSLLPEKVITIKYEELCETPEDTLKKIVNQVLSKSTPHEEQFQGQLTNGNKVALPFATWDKIEHVANQLM